MKELTKKELKEQNERLKKSVMEMSEELWELRYQLPEKVISTEPIEGGHRKTHIVTTEKWMDLDTCIEALKVLGLDPEEVVSVVMEAAAPVRVQRAEYVTNEEENE